MSVSFYTPERLEACLTLVISPRLVQPWLTHILPLMGEAVCIELNILSNTLQNVVERFSKRAS